MGRTIGLDLGTTNSVVSVIEGGEPKVIANAEGFRTTPSVVAFTKTGETLVGETAKRQAITNVDRTISSVKRHIGTNWTQKIDTKEYTPEEISARILSKLKKDAETYLGETVDSAVITVPAYFNNDQREKTQLAGKIAGLEVLRIINEPTAAALAYGLDKGKADETILVWDLGGGTYDVSLLQVDKADDGFATIEVLATSGDNRLGGDDWDKALVNHLIKKFKETSGVDLSGDKIALQRLKEAAEQAKKELSSSAQTDIQLPYISLTANGPVNLDEKITRSQFENLTADLLDRTIKPFEDAIKEAKITVNDIDHIVLVGGSTRMPAVVELVKKLTGGKQPNQGVNPDEVVSVGAATMASVLTGQRKDVLLLDVLPISVGIIVSGDLMMPLIERNTTIPTQRSEVYTTATDNQPAVTIQVAQGERKFAKDNKKLGQFDLTGIAPAPRGVPQIEVTFSIDANGILNVSAKDKGTGKEQAITITGASSISKEDVERMVREAEQNAKDDEARAEAQIARNNAEQLVYSSEKTLKEYEDKIPADVKSEVDSDIQSLKSALAGDDDDAVKSSVERLNQSLQRIGQSVYADSSQASTAAPEDADGASTDDDSVVDAEIVDEDK